jgi:hypothetical protein
VILKLAAIKARWKLLVFAGLPTLCATVLLWSIGTALVAPGTDSVSARLAEWGRNHYLSSVITFAENLQYDVHKPKVGGTLPSVDKSLLTNFAIGSKFSVKPVVTPALPGEGDLKTVVSVAGLPAIKVAYIRPDSLHSSYLTGVAVMNSSLLKFQLYPGFSEPGQLDLLKEPDKLSGDFLHNLVATFNSAFKIRDSLGGYYQNGVVVRPLVKAKASFVIYADGHADLGKWGTDLTLTKDVVSVRQNLSLLIDGGKLSPNLTSNVFATWGQTVKNNYYVWRSGIGVDASGNLIYVAGNALSVSSLANILLNAGAIRAMELDINQQWISYMWYSQPSTASAANGHSGLIPTKLIDFTRPADRYLLPSSRDFFAVYSR